MPFAKILGRDVPLKAPKSPTVAYEIAVYVGTNHARGLAAALGVCVSKAVMPKDGDGKPYLSKLLYKGDVAAYGQAVMDELIGAGMRPGEVIAAGIAANDLLTDIAFPTEEEVEAAADPFAGGGSTSPPSTSPASSVGETRGASSTPGGSGA